MGGLRRLPDMAIAAPLTPSLWPARPLALDPRGLALILLRLPPKTPRTTARALSRQVLCEALGGLLAQPAAAVRLAESPQGPRLDDPARDIRIGLSHAGAYILIGLAENRKLGVDIVRIDNFPELEATARLYLPEAARRALLAAPAAARASRFASGWARMEAGSKCLGLPLTEMNPERERALRSCRFVECRQIGGYRMAVALSD